MRIAKFGDITESGGAILNAHLLISEKRRKQMFKRYRRSIGVQDSPLFHQSFGRALRVRTTPCMTDMPFADIEAKGPTVRELINRGYLSNPNLKLVIDVDVFTKGFHIADRGIV